MGLENWSDGTANEERSIGRQRELKQEREGTLPQASAKNSAAPTLASGQWY